jgi:succinate-semialdehyde dehydrogenase/glutarate-semialdehyde dehydrogenase
MLAAQCMGTVKRVSLELGGNAPFIVFDDADIDKAVEGAIASKFRNTGQTCVCANRLLVQAGVYDAFAEKFAKKVGAMVVGDGLEGETHQGPLINDAAVDKVRRHVNDALDRGGRVLTGGPALDNATGQFYPPTVIADVPSDALAATEETFGPLAVLIRFHSEAEAIAIANDTRAGLAAYVYTRDQSRGWRVSEALDYGMVGLNTGLFSSEMAPFGGMKESGFGREGSYLGLQDYLEIKSICVEVASAGQV